MMSMQRVNKNGLCLVENVKWHDRDLQAAVAIMAVAQSVSDCGYCMDDVIPDDIQHELSRISNELAALAERHAAGRDWRAYARAMDPVRCPYCHGLLQEDIPGQMAADEQTCRAKRLMASRP